MGRVVKRKTRSDKKRDVKPTVDINLKDAIYRLSFITKTPVKDVAEIMIEHAFNNREIINGISISFRRDIRLDSTLYKGHIDNPHIGRRIPGVNERLTVRLTQQSFEVVSALAYALDVNSSRVCAILLDASMRNFDFINSYINKYLKSELSPYQLKELKNLLRYVNEGIEEKINLATLLSYIIDEVNAPIVNVKDAVTDFVIHHWRDNE